MKKWLFPVAALLLCVAMASCSALSALPPSFSLDWALSGYRTAEVFEGTADGETDNTAALQEAVNKLGTKKAVLNVKAGTYALSGKVTVPANVTLRFATGAKLLLQEGAELNLNGAGVLAAPYQIFSGNGKVSGTSPSVAVPQWFGAAFNGTDESAAMQKTVDVFAKVLIKNSSNGIRFGDVRLTKPVEIYGTASSRAKVLVAAGRNLFILASSDVSIANLNVTANGAQDKESAVFYFDTNACSMSNIEIHNVYTWAPAYTVLDAQSATNTVSNFTMTECTSSVNYREGIYMTDFTTGIVMKDVLINNVGVAHQINFPGWYMENVKEMLIENGDAAGGLNIGDRGHGFMAVNCEGISFVRCMTDYVNGVGLYLKNCKNMYINNMVVSLYEEEGYYFENVTDSLFETVKANGIYGTADFTDRGVRPALTLKNCKKLTFNNLTMQYNQSDGLVLDGCTEITVNSLMGLTNRGATLVEGNGCNHNVYNGVVSADNWGSGALTLTGSASKLIGAVCNKNYTAEHTGAITLK
ncbi:MAG: hypothetical protein IKD06_00315 [Clostridia bacterium]|nr:hypothetical protein [Clostridia bacterium]